MVIGPNKSESKRFDICPFHSGFLCAKIDQQRAVPNSTPFLCALRYPNEQRVVHIRHSILVQIKYPRCWVRTKSLNSVANTFAIKRTTSKLFIAARLFVACTTFMLLTITVMQREDHDGYQATHLFFMPRENWEMDEGREMLYEEEYYTRMDLPAVAKDAYGQPDVESVGARYEREHGSSFAERNYSQDSAHSGSGHTHGAALHRAPHMPGFEGNELPLVFTLAAITPDSNESFAGGGPLMNSSIWQGDVPSPPPRKYSTN